MAPQARCNKYKQIQSELESQLAAEQAKERDTADKMRELKERLRAIQNLGA